MDTCINFFLLLGCQEEEKKLCVCVTLLSLSLCNVHNFCDERGVSVWHGMTFIWNIYGYATISKLCNDVGLEWFGVYGLFSVATWIMYTHGIESHFK